jgi:hypothetical protein
MKNIKRMLFSIFFLTTLVGCGESADSRYESGYRDGYAVGYNTTCKIRSTMIHGDWDDKDYSRGYSDGRYAGDADCRAKSKE